jgi:hypothetical protein
LQSLSEATQLARPLTVGLKERPHHPTNCLHFDHWANDAQALFDVIIHAFACFEVSLIEFANSLLQRMKA